jgi:hypothetical protein
LGKFEDKMAVKTPAWGQIEVFEGSGLGESSRFDQALDAPVVAASAFLVHQEGQSLLKSEGCVLGVGELFLKAIPKGGQAELSELIEQRLEQHWMIPHW